MNQKFPASLTHVSAAVVAAQLPAVFTNSNGRVAVMASKDDIQFHSDRAKAELDRARIASSDAAAQAHIHLSALHLAEMRTLSGSDRLGPIHGH